MDVAAKIVDAGFEDVIIFDGYDDAFIGVSEDGRAVYDYDLMVLWLIEHEGMTEDEAVDWISYNTIRSLPYVGEKAPIVMYCIGDD